jgi:hypothetical protein
MSAITGRCSARRLTATTISGGTVEQDVHILESALREAITPAPAAAS